MLQRVTGPFREFGIAVGLLYVMGRGLRALSPRLNLFVYELMVQPIPEQPLLPDRFSKGFEIREIMRRDPDIERMPARPEIKESRFAQGAICIGAYKRGTLVGYLWLLFGPYEEDEVRCTYVPSPATKSVFDFDLYIFPEHRLGLGFAAIWNGANQYLRGRGIEFTFSRLTRFNLPSRRAHAHLGWKRVGIALFLQLWKLEFMCASVKPYLHVGFMASSRVRLQLDARVLRDRPQGSTAARPG